MEATLYARDQGPQCFMAEIIFQYESGEPFVEQLRKSGLTWYWHSVRENGRNALPGLPSLPRYRPLTLLADQNWQDLVLDINEELDTYLGNDDPPPGEHRNLMLFGLDSDLPAPVETSLDEAGQRFLQDLGPLEIVLDRIQDLSYEFLYFRRPLNVEVQALLDAWRLEPEHATNVRPYKKLGVSQLESFFPDMKNWYRP